MGVVPSIPATITASGDASRIRAAAPVVGNGQWREMADLMNWLSGRGAQLICGNPRMSYVEDEGYGSSIQFGNQPPGLQQVAYRAYVWPRTQFSTRVWLVALGIAGTGGGTVKGQFKDITATTTLGTFEMSTNTEDVSAVQVFRVVEPWTAATGEVGLVVNTEDLNTSDVVFHGFCCFELPFASHSDIPNEQTLNSKEPIYSPTDHLESLDLVNLTADALPAHATRAGLFSWYSPTAITITATTYTGTSNVFRVAPTVIPRSLYTGVSTTSVNWAARVVTTGGNSQIKLTMTSGDTDTVTITSTTVHYVTGSVDVRNEDISRLTTDGGIRTGSRDFVTVECVTLGTNVKISGFYMGAG